LGVLGPSRARLDRGKQRAERQQHPARFGWARQMRRQRRGFPNATRLLVSRNGVERLWCEEKALGSACDLAQLAADLFGQLCVPADLASTP
jgi:hypothetical protein